MSTPVALVTGASRGIGYATAALLARNGYRTVCNYHANASRAQQLAQQLQEQGYEAVAIGADVGDPQQVENLFQQVERQWGGVDLLVNNAGLAAPQQLLTDCTQELWHQLFRTNVDGMFYCCKRAIPHMVHQKAGCIINLSSIWGISGASCEVPYSATKGAVIAFTKALAQELGLSGIRVNCVAPGVIRTEMNSALDEQTWEELRTQTPLQMIGEPEDIAQCILYLASEQARFLTGQVISPNGGMVL